MAAGFSAATNITELIPEITLEAQFIYQNKMLGSSLVSYEDVSRRPGLTVEFPRFTEVTGSTAVAETAAPASHQMDLTMPTLTIARRSVYVILTDLAKKGAAGDIVSKIGRAMGMAKAKQDDNAIFGVVTGTTDWTTAAGATNANVTITNVLAGLLLLEKNEIEEQPVAVFHPHSYNGIRSALTPIANDDGVAVGVANDMARNAFVSRAFGIDWYVTNRIGSGTVNASANCYNNLLFVRSGLGYAHAWLEVDGIEMARDAEEAHTKMIYNYADSAGVIHAPGVCKIYGTSA